MRNFLTSQGGTCPSEPLLVMPTQHRKLGKSTSSHVCYSSKQCHSSPALTSNTRQHRSNDTTSTLDLGPHKFAPKSYKLYMFIIFRRQLRESADNYVAGNIYINRDLSPIEAKIAYQKQVKRRERLILCQNLRSATSNTQWRRNVSQWDGS